LSLDFVDTLTTPDIEAAVLAIEQNVHAKHPEVVALFVKPQTDRMFQEAMRRRFGTDETD
jgi:hypothetical protein